MLAALCLLTALLVQLPASLLAEHLNRTCAGYCQLAQVTGVWWSGQARLFLRSTRNSVHNDDWLDHGPLHWSVHWGYPLRLAIRVAGGDAEFEASWQARTLTARQLKLPAAWLLSLPIFKLPAGGWTGEINLLALTLVTADQPRWQSHGQIVWQQAASTLLPELPPATLSLHWQTDANAGGEATFRSATVDPLAIAGQIQITAGGALAEIGLAVTPGAGASPAITRRLAAIAQPDPAQAGRYLLQHRFR